MSRILNAELQGNIILSSLLLKDKEVPSQRTYSTYIQGDDSEMITSAGVIINDTILKT